MTKDRGEEGDKTGKTHVKESRSKEGAKKKKEEGIPTKVVIRRLPPTLTEETLVEELGPLPDHDFFLFVAADMSLVPHAFCRAYINFKNPEDIIGFKDKFDGYIFNDTSSKKVEYPAIVEFAPYQKVPKGRSKKKDTKCATIEQDPDYLKFLESLKSDNAGDAPPANIESLLEEIEARDRKKEETKMTTPLLDFIKNRRAAAARAREEAREERRRKEEERRRRREEERRKRREEERRKKREKERAERAKKEKEGKDKDGSDGKDEESVKSVKLLKNPEREKDQKDTEKHRPKDQKRDRTPPRKDDRQESARERRDRERRERRDKERERRDRDTREDRDEDRDYGKNVTKDSGDRKEATKDDKEREKERQRQREKERERQRQRERERKQRQQWEKEERERKRRQEREKEKKRNSAEKTDAEQKTDDKEQPEARHVQERRLSTESDTSRKSDATEKGRGAKGGEDDGERELTKEEARAERRRLRNKDRPTMQLYRPGARRRQQDTGKGKNTEETAKDSPREKAEDNKQEE
ncbi:PREDICTED: regulator of nonsense transcripts 3B-like [Branchiostoma belcheri]|uniref:Regulator of nonsense transcripts 3B-like n=1 Tax=Branchiostoma belcheri TaxID=7741 RepID=A0A6P4YH98_BRABE|nr:PREDICTED: regulator of nonsense transcripts 3B-like [Branchiostoma belcheri]